jgi:hypothetical protein
MTSAFVQIREVLRCRLEFTSKAGRQNHSVQVVIDGRVAQYAHREIFAAPAPMHSAHASGMSLNDSCPFPFALLRAYAVMLG